MLFQQSIETYVLIGVVLAMAATVQAVSGFGFNLLAAPLLVAFLEPMAVVPALHLAWLPVGVALVIHNRHDIRVSRVLWFFLPALPTLLLGVWLLNVSRNDEINEIVLKRGIGLVTIAVTIGIMLIGRHPFKRERLWQLCAGAVSGVMAGTTAMSGPPLILLGLNQGWPSKTFRAELLLYFTMLHGISLPFYYWNGLLTETAVGYAASGAPGLIIGFFVGIWMARHVSEKRFRFIAIVLLCLAGVMPWLR